ncbi:type I-E CRISPR-associated protein Cse1/CasA [Synergistes jonesii]|uniref:type I-E CRISPR-associated protein Cse1/CasA n=1 Tax=Synergistes jonesii TaxID=2754 RepID=UPI00248D5FBD|nr:type I-E CRISPR-associated protein Cse1/CasA [Synergistes jonesii]
MASFDVLHGPWIPVERNDGGVCELGIIDLLTQAHELNSLRCESPLENYAVTRLLAAFIMDAYQWKFPEDRKALFQAGRFDKDVLEKYVELCLNEGASFDLFDKERPFMQAAYDPRLDKEKKNPVSVLVQSLPSGNNHVHFDHRMQGCECLTAAEALRALCATYVFCTAGRTGPSSVNNKPCIYIISEGKNLFESLVLSAVSKREIGNIPWDEPKIAWRCFEKVIPKKEIASVSLLSAFTWMPRRVTLIPEEPDNTGKIIVKEVYRQPGLNFKGNDLWRDPHAPYQYRKPKNSSEWKWISLKPDVGRALWRDIGALTAAELKNTFRRQPLILANRKKVEGAEDSIAKVTMTGLLTDQEKYISLSYDTFDLPAVFLSNGELGDFLCGEIETIEKIAAIIPNEKGYKKLGKETCTQLQSEFFAAMYLALFSDYIPYLAALDREKENWAIGAMARLNEKIKAAIKNIKESADTRFGGGARNLRDMVAAGDSFYRECMKELKKRSSDDGKREQKL